MEEIKQWVLHHVPDAVSEKDGDWYFVYGTIRNREKVSRRNCIGIGETEIEAWEDAKNELNELLQQPDNQ